jgi:hypothetical protein
MIQRLEDASTDASVVLTAGQIEAMRVELQALQGLSRLKGLIVEKKVSATVRANLPGDAMGQQVAECLDELAPGERKAIAGRVKALEARQAKRKTLQPPVELQAEPAE